MLPKAHRLTSSRDFENVFKRGVGYVHKLAILKVLRRERSAPARFGISVSPKVGTIVARNREKRRIREAVRLILPALETTGYDAVIIGRPAVRQASFGEIAQAVEQLFRMAGLTNPVRGKVAQ